MAGLPALLAEGPAAADKFYAAIRNGDAAAVRQMIKDGADVNSRDGRGSTLLMHAAASGTAETVRTLILAGADVNAKNNGEATALMWATGDMDKVKLLVDSGADLNARSKRGRTAVQIAAAQAGNIEVVKYLAGKDAEITGAPIVEAAIANDTAMVAFLLDKGQDPNGKNPSGITPLMAAAGNGNSAMVKLLLARGADVNAKSGEGFGPSVRNGNIALGHLTPLLLSAAAGDAETVRLLLEAGAAVNAQDIRGMTPLMLAVATDRANPEIIGLLLKNGASPDMKSNVGETVQAWAAKSRAPKAPKFKEVSANSNDVRAAAEKSMALLLKSSDSFLKEGGCASCHSHNITTVAASLARAKGVMHDQAAAAGVARANYLQFTAFANMLLERLDPPAVEIIAYAGFAAASDGAAPDRTTDALAHNLVAQQHEDGSWGLPGIARPPITDGRISTTAIAIRVLRQYAPPSRRKEMDERAVRAARWAMDEPANSTEDLVMQLLAAHWAGLDSGVSRPVAQRLLALQREDGGWSQNTNLNSDAYATGTTLYALQTAGVVSVKEPAYQRGVRYLVSTQAADGSWHVASRTPKFQPYFESGFPYGHDQWISQMATGWASAALSAAVPETPANGTTVARNRSGSGAN